MLHQLVKIAVASAIVAFASQAGAQGMYGTAEEAKAMLLKAVAAVRADKRAAFDMFNRGEGGFLDRDLYPFCGNVLDGKILALANPNAKQNLGRDVRDNKDATGKAYGQEIYAAAQKEEGHISSVSYAFPRPNDPTPTAKVSFITRVGDVFCAVGFYEAPPRR